MYTGYICMYKYQCIKYDIWALVVNKVMILHSQSRAFFVIRYKYLIKNFFIKYLFQITKNAGSV